MKIDLTDLFYNPEQLIVIIKGHSRSFCYVLKSVGDSAKYTLQNLRHQCDMAKSTSLWPCQRSLNRSLTLSLLN